MVELKPEIKDARAHRQALASMLAQFMHGEEISFTAGDVTYKGKVTGNTIEGTMTTAKGTTTAWRATKNK